MTSSSNTILVPLDSTPMSNAALPLTRTLARAMHASVVLLRVLTHADAATGADIKRHLEGIADELRGSDISVDAVVRHGQVADAILKEVNARAATVVVMRTHARVGLERVFLGSVADQVLERLPVPLVLMRPGERRVTAIRTLLVPVDGSPGGALALETAKLLARATGASLDLVQVTVPIALQGMVTSEFGGMSYYDPDWDDETVAEAKSYVGGLVTHLRQEQLTADGQVFTGPDAAQGIVAAAEKHEADLIVMSTRALTGPARTLLGSVANAVVRTAHSPVVLVHRAEDSEQP
jgi:nucleotide-binding universal stress UspA family protein